MSAAAGASAASGTGGDPQSLLAELNKRFASSPIAKSKHSVTFDISTTSTGNTKQQQSGQLVVTVNGSIPVRPYGSDLNVLIEKFVADHAMVIGSIVRNRTLKQNKTKQSL